jgi:hypothetical protein
MDQYKDFFSLQLIMLKLMITRDLMQFVALILIVMFGFGAATQALTYPSLTFGSTSVGQPLFILYYSILGLKIGIIMFFIADPVAHSGNFFLDTYQVIHQTNRIIYRILKNKLSFLMCSGRHPLYWSVELYIMWISTYLVC